MVETIRRMSECNNRATNLRVGENRMIREAEEESRLPASGPCPSATEHLGRDVLCDGGQKGGSAIRSALHKKGTAALILVLSNHVQVQNRRWPKVAGSCPHLVQRRGDASKLRTP